MAWRAHRAGPCSTPSTLVPGNEPGPPGCRHQPGAHHSLGGRPGRGGGPGLAAPHDERLLRHRPGEEPPPRVWPRARPPPDWLLQAGLASGVCPSGARPRCVAPGLTGTAPAVLCPAICCGRRGAPAVRALRGNNGGCPAWGGTPRAGSQRAWRWAAAVQWFTAAAEPCWSGLAYRARWWLSSRCAPSSTLTTEGWVSGAGGGARRSARLAGLHSRETCTAWPARHIAPGPLVACSSAVAACIPAARATPNACCVRPRRSLPAPARSVRAERRHRKVHSEEHDPGARAAGSQRTQRHALSGG